VILTRHFWLWNEKHRNLLFNSAILWAR